MTAPLRLLLCAALLQLAACGGGKPALPHKKAPVRTAQQIRIRHIDQDSGGRELFMHGFGLVGTPYRWGGSSQSGFDCSGMVQYLYKNALGVSLPRSSRDMAAASRTIDKGRLKIGDLVFFNTSGRGVSHVGLYIGNGQFLHAPHSGSSVQTESLSKPYYAKRFVKAGTFF